MTKNNQGFSNSLIAIIVAVALVGAGVIFYYKKDAVNILLDMERTEEQDAIKKIIDEKIEAENNSPIEENLKKISAPKEAEDLESIFKQLFSDKYSAIMEDINITISKRDATHVWGSVRFAEAVGGGWFLGYKGEEEWIIVQDGNGTISCETIEPYGFSADMVPECVTAGGELITREIWKKYILEGTRVRLSKN